MSSAKQKTSSGTLYVVATPIGNLSDFSARAKETLQQVSLICCEDTRVFGKLAQHYGISAPKLSYHEQNEASRVSETVSKLEQGLDVALVSDAGTPGISDPGYRLVRACRKAGINVTSVPGASACISALSISGLPTDRFYFEGFLPVKKGKKETCLQTLLDLDVSAICYESPHRIEHTLETLEKLAPTREIFLARELTKLHEETLFGTPREVLDALLAPEAGTQKRVVRGEVVLIIAPLK